MIKTFIDKLLGKRSRSAHRFGRREEVQASVHGIDLALLEKVDVPVATNPDDRLRAIAVARGWRILDLFTKIT